MITQVRLLLQFLKELMPQLSTHLFACNLPYFILLLALNLESQNRKPIAWTGLLNELTYNRWDASFEIENSRLLKPSRQDYFTAISHVEYSIRDFRLGAGISWWVLYDAREFGVPEWRPHEQLKWTKEQNNFSFLQRSRIENRWIRDTSHRELLPTRSFILRPRFLFQAALTLCGEREKKGNLQFVVSDELILEYGKTIAGFSENRYYTGLWYSIKAKTTLQLGYVWIFARHDKLNNSDIIYFTLRNNFSLN